MWLRETMANKTAKIYAGIEAGGTKFICGVGNSSGEVLERLKIPTTSPKETMGLVIEFLAKMDAKYKLSAIGIASFGPIDPDPASPTYGTITTTSKPGWGYFNIVGPLKENFHLPIGFDTDVNGAALGESRWGNGKGVDYLVYWTVGTGIGAGGIIAGKMMHGLIHPEMGHTFVNHDFAEDPFEGVCPFHKDCLEGLASGLAMKARWKVKSATDLPADHRAWDLEAKYLGYAMANCIETLSPKKIIIGGGVMFHKELYEKIRKKTRELLNGYIKHRLILEEIEDYIVAPGLGSDAGVCGAIALAEASINES
jgi:fructokinase